MTDKADGGGFFMEGAIPLNLTPSLESVRVIFWKHGTFEKASKI